MSTKLSTVRGKDGQIATEGRYENVLKMCSFSVVGIPCVRKNGNPS